MPSTTINRGNILSTTIIGPSLTPAQTAAYTSAVQTFNVAGLLAGDLITVVGHSGAQTAGMFIAECDCYNNGVISIQFVNVTASPATAVSGNYYFMVNRLDGPAPINMA
jgi:hypothetical protein